MNYHVARLAPEGILSIKKFESYSEAEMHYEHYCRLYPTSWVEVVSEDDLIECGVAV